MWNKAAVQELERRRALAKGGGGEARIKKQHESGKCTAAERLEMLFDGGVYQELNQLVQPIIPEDGISKSQIGDGVVTGYGMIDGRYAVAVSQDFTVNGGTLGKNHAAKICEAMDLALKLEIPIISINDSGGARIEEGIEALDGYGDIFLRNVKASGVIPQISVIMGPCAGGACYSPALCDFVFMVKNTGYMFITGPQVIKAVTNEEISAEELGGYHVHMKTSGVSHFAFDNEQECLEGVRRLLAYLPANHTESAPADVARPVNRSKMLEGIIPDNKRKCYDMLMVIASFADEKSFLEIQPDFAPNAVIGLCRLDGETIGIVGNQPQHISGALDVDASDKIARFVRFCDCFNIPLLTLVDVPAFLPGVKQEREGIIRHGAKMLYAYAEASVPKVTVILRKAFGGAYIAMCSKSLGADVVYALPIAEIAVMGAEGAVKIIARKQIQDAANPEEEKERLVARYEHDYLNPYRAAAHSIVNEVILPTELRDKLSSSFLLLRHKKRAAPKATHGNIPL